MKIERFRSKFQIIAAYPFFIPLSRIIISNSLQIGFYFQSTLIYPEHIAQWNNFIATNCKWIKTIFSE